MYQPRVWRGSSSWTFRVVCRCCSRSLVVEVVAMLVELSRAAILLLGFLA